MKINLDWKNNDLLLEGNKVMSIVERDDGTWIIKFPDGSFSQDGYNRARAKDLAIKTALKHIQQQDKIIRKELADMEDFKEFLEKSRKLGTEDQK